MLWIYDICDVSEFLKLWFEKYLAVSSLESGVMNQLFWIWKCKGRISSLSNNFKSFYSAFILIKFKKMHLFEIAAKGNSQHRTIFTGCETCYFSDKMPLLCVQIVSERGVAWSERRRTLQQERDQPVCVCSCRRLYRREQDLCWSTGDGSSQSKL